MCRDTQAIHHFWIGLQIFVRIDCVHLQQQVIRLYIFEYSLIIMVNARWLHDASTYLDWSNSRIYAYLCSTPHPTEERGRVSRAH